MEHFIEGDSILQIRSCGHRFKEAPLLIWFRRDSRCPICRYDIRNYTSSTPVDISSASIPTPTTGVREVGTEPGGDMENNYNQAETDSDEETMPDLISLNDSDSLHENSETNVEPSGESNTETGTNTSENVHSNTDEIVERLTQLFSEYIQDFSQSHSFTDISGGTYMYSIEFPVNLNP
jgi:hypothetical protein